MMKKIVILSFLVFLVVTVQAQTGINYKAILKDTNGNVVANTSIDVEFYILQGAAQTVVYEESHTTTTDSNGVFILNIGEGSPDGGTIFNDITWATDNHYLNVLIDDGNNLIDFGITAFQYVPYAQHATTASEAQNITGLEQITENGNTGWRLKGVNPTNYGDIGNNAVDLSINGSSSINGATGSVSFATGIQTSATGSYSTAFGNGTNAVSNASIAMGDNTIASGYSSTATGLSTQASGTSAFSMGIGTNASSFASVALGRYNLGNGTPNDWLDIDPLFEIGNGTSDSNRNNALTIRKNGLHIINSNTVGIIVNAGNSILDDGIQIVSPGNDGVDILSPTGNGIYVSGAGNNGINVFSANSNGGFLRGTESGIHAVSSIDANPDIILGGTLNTTTGDDGIISSDPSYAGSDIFLRSYDAVVVQLDYNNGAETGEFEIKAGDGTEVFEVRESGNATLAGSLTQNSDRRLKEHIHDLPYGLNEVLQLQPKTYNWKHKDQDKKSLGLIAQEVQPIISEIVNEQDDEAKTLGISYTELIPVLINAIKEQQKKIDALEKKVSDLRPLTLTKDNK